ncbi:hypothetical protein ACF8C6_09025 [Pseudomonas sp. zbq_18]|uniref:hypothetical protein n=1 Tax=Pseudomonas sp. zbq_18 TaxID=3367251 RepID=UPI00370AA2FB
MDKIDQFFEQEGIDGRLTPEQAAQLMALSAQGDTDVSSSENGGAPEATPEPEAKQAEAQDATSTTDPESADEPDDAVVVAKDGKTIIPYATLKAERTEKQQWKGQATEYQAQLEAAQQEIAELKAQAQARADAGIAPTATDQQLATAQAALDAGVDPAIFGDFSEEGLANGINQLAEQRVKPVLAKVDQLEQQVATLLKEREQSAQAANTKTFAEAVAAKHADWQEVVESDAFDNWVNSQPSFVQERINAVLDDATVEQAVELLDAFKATQKAPAPQAGTRTAAQQVIASTKAQAPVSLSDIPGAAGGAASEFEVLASLSPNDLSARLNSMPQEKVEAFLNWRM